MPTIICAHFTIMLSYNVLHDWAIKLQFRNYSSFLVLDFVMSFNYVRVRATEIIPQHLSISARHMIALHVANSSFGFLLPGHKSTPGVALGSGYQDIDVLLVAID